MQLNKRLGLLLLSSFTLAQMSCLKDSPNNASPTGGSNNVVEFQNSSIPVSYTSVFPQYDNGVIIKNDTGSFVVNLNYTGAVSVAPQDIKITLALSKNALDSFNADQGTAYTIPQPDIYTISLAATISKGARQVTIRVGVNTGAPDFDYTATYALPLVITQVSYGVVSSNFGTAIYSFAPRNKYDGSYALTEKLVGWGGYGIADGVSNSWPNNIGFVTSGQFGNTTWDGTWGALQLGFTSSGGTTGFGATNPQYTFDGSTDKLTAVTNLTPDDGRGRKFALNPAVTTSRYDASTKTIYAAYIMYQNGRPNQFIYDTLVYQGIR